jgi:hypothetical protein
MFNHWGAMIGMFAAAWIFSGWFIFNERHPDQYYPLIPWILPIIPTFIAGWGMLKLAMHEWNPWFTASRFDGAYVFLRGSSAKFRESLPLQETLSRPHGFEVVVQQPPSQTIRGNSSAHTQQSAPPTPPPPPRRLPPRPSSRRPPDYPK